MDEDNHLHRFGTPLEPLEKDEVPAKKPLAIEDQIVKDENGKRRFHGAFTGGFSAGFWNTVGSLEGWTPQNFKSSRGEKASKVEQRPEDFMDNEDLGEFGIAPQGIRTRDEFSKESEQEQRTGLRKRKPMQPQVAGPIPGVPVLEQLLRPVRDKVAVRILKSMGWKPGQGVGPRQTRKEKRQATARNKREQYLLDHYGDEGLPSSAKQQNREDAADDEDSEDEDDDEDITFAPDDYEPMFYTPKDNRFGMSYSGLSRAPVLSKSSTSATPMQHINLFGQLETATKQKPFSIRGQAFGVGAFEEEDEDIYAKDDMTRYDFSLADKQPQKKKAQYVQQRHVIDGFSEDKSNITHNKPFVIDLPRDFKPRNWLQRRSRFTPLDAERARKIAETDYKKAGLGRHDLNPEQRAQLLGESQVKKNPFKTASSVSTQEQQERSKSLLELISAKSSNFTKGGLITTAGEELPAATVAPVELSKELKESNTALQAQAASKTKNLASSQPSSGFKPFLADEAKQQRYEKFLAANLKDDKEITEFLAELQPVTLSLWDREMEKKEFMQASKIYRPLAGLMLDRFVSEATVQEGNAKQDVQPEEKLKIVMKRTKVMWKPSALLCKRYNIAEPFGGALPEVENALKGKAKMSIFDYLETSVNTKANFQTPTIIPKHIELPKQQQGQQQREQLTLSTSKPTPTAPVEEAEVKPPLEPANSTASKPIFVPKTPLEHAVEAARDKPISEKTDLFKSIFDDSDEDTNSTAVAQGEPQELQRDAKIKEMQAALGLPSATATSAAAVNLLRNNSPPRGIFAALFKPAEEQMDKSTEPAPPKFAPIAGNKLKIAYKSREERLKNDRELAMAEVPQVDLYGPKLPSQLKPTEVQAEASIDAKLQQLWQQHAPKKRKAEQWVERTLSSSEDSDEDSTESSSDDSDVKAKKSKSKKSSSKKSKKSKQKAKKKSKKSEKSKHKSKKKKSKH
ncbi:G patch domain-containing protein 1 homolog isoform X2 [Drosophila navojoa]|uniref:G patch domain-containing protein 1 homolog isoform X2 n=1 Tax=Drosophila navojoa TaxID=7232 RepID=UPI0008468260|nr:G patch domain-containing protein 1 homolog isoform X2 [Drosophila navojoa]